MYLRKEDACYASEIADFLKLDLVGENCVIYYPCSIDAIKDNSLLFLSDCSDFDFEKLSSFSELLIILNEKCPRRPKCSHLLSAQPRVDFIRVLYEFFIKDKPTEMHQTAVIEKGARIGKNVTIGANSFIGSDVEIGDATQILQNVVITGKVTIGNGCLIKANATIGSEGFSFVFDKNTLEHFPQIGGIRIGNGVWVGANATIEMATLDDTIIEDNVKIDDLVQIGHNAIICESTQITAGAIVCSRVKIGKKCWIAPNACIDCGVTIGNNSVIGIGTVVRKDVSDNTVVAGNPARVIRKKS